LKVYVDSFRSIYAINSGIAFNAAVATGRYPEDVYYGGNVGAPGLLRDRPFDRCRYEIQPWYLSTFAVAEQLYEALIVWNLQQNIDVTVTSLAFFSQFIPSLVTGSYAASTSTYSALVTSVKSFADGFILINANYTPSNGSLAEQYTHTNGSPLSARDLTWSYASALTAFAARDGFTPSSWGAAGLTVPSSCAANPGPIVSITFNVRATTIPGGERKPFPWKGPIDAHGSNVFPFVIRTENVFLVGSVPELRNWCPGDAIPLSPANYPAWSGEYLNPGLRKKKNYVR